MLKKYSLLTSILYTVFLTIISLININTVTKNLPTNSDKIAHCIVHFIFTILWFITFFYFSAITKTRALFYAFIGSLVFGVSIEFLQGCITLSRQSDVNDIIANIIGSFFAVLIIITIKKGVLKNNNTLLF